MKYLWLTFFLLLGGLLLQIKLAAPVENPFADGRLACLPLPPARDHAEPPLLPAPAIERIPPPQTPVRVQATSIEIFDPASASGLMAETRNADNIDWGLPRSLPADSPVALAYAVEPRLIMPVPVNTPAPTPELQPALHEIISNESPGWAAPLEKWKADRSILALSLSVANSANVAPESDARFELAPLPSDEVARTEGSTMALYPVPEPEPVETASLEPKRLISPPQSLTPNLYLPEGALDEEGAKLTLISPELKLYELPDETSSAAADTLKSGDQVRPLTRLRNAEGYDWIKLSHNGKTWWAQAEYFIRVDPRNRRQFPKGNLAVGKEKVDKDSALPVDYRPDDLVEIEGKYTFGAKDVQLRKEAAEAFEQMAEAAERDGLSIRIFSGFRDFAYQKRLYLKAIQDNGPKQDGTAAPGYSEHQLGTTADISNNNRRTILQGTFGETKEGRWLHENSERFGFRKSYTQENSEKVGYKPEPWHFRYVGIPEQAGSRDIAGKE